VYGVYGAQFIICGPCSRQQRTSRPLFNVRRKEHPHPSNSLFLFTSNVLGLTTLRLLTALVPVFLERLRGVVTLSAAPDIIFFFQTLSRSGSCRPAFAVLTRVVHLSTTLFASFLEDALRLGLDRRSSCFHLKPLPQPYRASDT
jgi:hypothetical protein